MGEIRVMDAVDIFKEIIGKRLEPLLVKYNPYTEKYLTYPYRHIFLPDFEPRFANVLFDTIIFYAYEKAEIEKEYSKGRLNDLRRISRIAYEDRVPKTERETDGLLGELALDSMIKLFFPDIELLYSRAKYSEKIPHKEKDLERKAHEIKGYDGLVFSNENGQKYFWAGQAKTGSWKYCFDSIREDINKSIISYYFSDSIAIMCDLMRAVNNTSPDLMGIIDDINDIIYDCNDDREVKTKEIIDYFKKNHITIRVPCLLMPDESNYADESELLKLIKEKVHTAFLNFDMINPDALNVEILLMVFPLRNIREVRRLFLEVRKP